MPLHFKIENLEEFKILSDTESAQVIEAYKKGYHFLLFYGKLFGIIALSVAAMYMTNMMHTFSWFFKGGICIASIYIITFLVNIIEINLVAKRVIRDLVKDIRRQNGR